MPAGLSRGQGAALNIGAENRFAGSAGKSKGQLITIIEGFAFDFGDDFTDLPTADSRQGFFQGFVTGDFLGWYPEHEKYPVLIFFSYPFKKANLGSKRGAIDVGPIIWTSGIEAFGPGSLVKDYHIGGDGLDI